MTTSRFWFLLIGMSIMLLPFGSIMHDAGTEGFTALAFVVLSLAWYFSPFITAMLRGHRQRLAIFWFNFFLGWTFIGWVVALVWSCTADRQLQGGVA